jgi:hypothetical protein
MSSSKRRLNVSPHRVATPAQLAPQLQICRSGFHFMHSSAHRCHLSPLCLPQAFTCGEVPVCNFDSLSTRACTCAMTRSLLSASFHSEPVLSCPSVG